MFEGGIGVFLCFMLLERDDIVIVCQLFILLKDDYLSRIRMFDFLNYSLIKVFHFNPFFL